jgi:hypothetical protein
MRTVNGIGTRLYGRAKKRSLPPKLRVELGAKGFAPYSYQAVKWFVFLFVPLIPLGTYRVIPSDQGFFSSEQSSYLMEPAPWDWLQVLVHYAIAWGGLWIVKRIVWGAF